MGLDGVELVMAYEEEFGLVIEDKQAEKMITPRHVIDYIMTRIDAARGVPCASAQTFHRLRRSLTQQTRIARHEVRLEAPLARLIPLRGRREHWQQLQTSIGVAALPELKRSRLLVVLCATAALLTFIVSWYGLLTGALSRHALLSFEISVVLAALVGWAGARATRPLKLSFVPPVSTVREMVCFLVRQTGGIAPRCDRTREEVAAKVRQTTIEILGISAESYHEDARFIEDLGVG